MEYFDTNILGKGKMMGDAPSWGCNSCSLAEHTVGILESKNRRLIGGFPQRCIPIYMCVSFTALPHVFR